MRVVVPFNPLDRLFRPSVCRYGVASSSWRAKKQNTQLRPKKGNKGKGRRIAAALLMQGPLFSFFVGKLSRLVGRGTRLI